MCLGILPQYHVMPTDGTQICKLGGEVTRQRGLGTDQRDVTGSLAGQEPAALDSRRLTASTYLSLLSSVRIA